jgi:hypothetical protein
LAGDKNATGILRIVAAVSLVDIGPLDRAADECLAKEKTVPEAKITWLNDDCDAARGDSTPERLNTLMMQTKGKQMCSRSIRVVLQPTKKGGSKAARVLQRVKPISSRRSQSRVCRSRKYPKDRDDATIERAPLADQHPSTTAAAPDLQRTEIAVRMQPAEDPFVSGPRHPRRRPRGGAANECLRNSFPEPIRRRRPIAKSFLLGNL